MCIIYTKLGFPNETEEDLLISTHLRLLTPDSFTLSDQFTTADLEPSAFLIGQARLLLLPPYPAPFSITRYSIENLRDRLDRAAALLSTRVATCNRYIREIQIFWSDLEIPIEERLAAPLKIELDNLNEVSFYIFFFQIVSYIL